MREREDSFGAAEAVGSEPGKPVGEFACLVCPRVGPLCLRVGHVLEKTFFPPLAHTGITVMKQAG